MIQTYQEPGSDEVFGSLETAEVMTSSLTSANWQQGWDATGKNASVAMPFLPIKMQFFQVHKSFEIQRTLFSNNQALFFLDANPIQHYRTKSMPFGVFLGIRTDWKLKPTTPFQYNYIAEATTQQR